jgi:hypothetical protein
LNDVEQHKYRCLVRAVIKMRVRDRDEAYKFLVGWVRPDGSWAKGWNELHPGSTLESDVKQQWKLGNRGEDGDWK